MILVRSSDCYKNSNGQTMNFQNAKHFVGPRISFLEHHFCQFCRVHKHYVLPNPKRLTKMDKETHVFYKL